MIETSKEIVARAIKDYDPFAMIALFSGGNDSLVLLSVLNELNIKLDAIVHVNTGTGIPQTLEFVRKFCAASGTRYIEASAGNVYEKYVLTKGFFGRGLDAHTYCYHLLKASPLRKAISLHLRQGKKNRRILLFNGVRVDESDNRKYNFAKNEITISDPTRTNDLWVNVIHWWKTQYRDQYIQGNNLQRNPVSIELNRSAECMCGSMQGTFDRYIAGQYCPAWGKWLDDLEKKVIDNGFPWKWGEEISKSHLMERDGQLNLFQPMCVGCKSLK
jgi:3'-phosphoadenosine 5'-phosphosulfate sulfotransferase (PAPS reductase)/FAD synthetase